jgi:hypothetical protein
MTFEYSKKMKEVIGESTLAKFFIKWFFEHQSWYRIHFFNLQYGLPATHFDVEHHY